MLKRLGKVFGPLVCALLLLVGLYLVFPVSQPHHLGKEKNSAVALTKAGFKSRVQKLELSVILKPILSLSLVQVSG